MLSPLFGRKSKVPASDPRQNFRTQIFWVGEDKKNKEDLWDWYSYVCRTPQLPGHIIIANKQGYSEKAPNGFEEVLNLNIEFVLKWSQINKAVDCHPIFFRMNIEREQFRVHILPVSEQEIQEASLSLHTRIPKSEGNGGFVHYLGNREDMADRCLVKFNDISGDQTAIEKLMHECGITKVVEQFRDVVNKQGYRSQLPSADTI
jgi:hypothetical protein